MPTIVYTTYDASVSPVKCFVNVEVTANGALIAKQQIPVKPNDFVQHYDQYYYVSYEPTESGSKKRCCVYLTSEGSGPDGKAIHRQGSFFFDGNPKTLP